MTKLLRFINVPVVAFALGYLIGVAPSIAAFFGSCP